jgi:hypothetical protein
MNNKLSQLAYKIGRAEALANIAYIRRHMHSLKRFRLLVLKYSKLWQDQSYVVSGRDLTCPVVSIYRRSLLEQRSQLYQHALTNTSNKYKESICK